MATPEEAMTISKAANEEIVLMVRHLMSIVDAGHEGRGVIVESLPDGAYEITVRRATGPVIGTGIVHTPRRTGE